MKHLLRVFVLAIAVALAVGVLAAAGKTLDFYFIDVEGGQSTLIVTPAGETLLVDTGYPERDGRDPGRIMAAMRDAHVSAIDYLLITHMHEDHNGGAAELARRVPIRAFVDYGDLVETSADQVASFTAYNEARTSAEKAGSRRSS
jgi:competence protein ComEC